MEGHPIFTVVKPLVLFLLLLTSLHTHGQILRGTVKDGISGDMLATVVVTNERTNQKVYTNTYGDYSLNAIKGDVVSFNLVGYKPQSYTVPASVGAAEMYISLFQMGYDLEEVTLRSKYTPYQIDSMERRSTYTRALARQKGGGVMSPVSLLAEKLSKNSKRAYRFQKDFYTWEEGKFIASRYTPELVVSQTKLVGDTVAFFMNAHPMPYDFARTASELELKIWIREQYQEWLKNPEIPAISTEASNSLKKD